MSWKVYGCISQFKLGANEKILELDAMYFGANKAAAGGNNQAATRPKKCI